MKALFIFALFICSVSAFAADGNRLLDICSVAEKTEFQPAELTKLSACTNYIDGVLDTQVMWQGMMKNDRNTVYHKVSVCSPPDSGINPLQGARIVMKYLRDNPDKLHWTASALVINAIHDAFPCK